MNGSIETASVSEVEKERDHGQSSLYDYGASDDPKTYIAVVSEPNDTGILDATDEWFPELGMPTRKLNEFRKLRSGYNSQDPVECHNKAYDKCNLNASFESHALHDDEAHSRVQEIAERVESGEEIVLVCFEREPKQCHRHKLQDIIENEIESSTEEQTSSFAQYA